MYSNIYRKKGGGIGQTKKHYSPLLFVKILINEEFSFADYLERLELKRSTNEEVYKEILQLFQEEMNKEEFLQRNTIFGKGKFKPVQVDTKKLQAKYNATKRKWHQSNPEWYKKIDSILGDTNTDSNEVVFKSLDTSYSQEVIQNDDENESFEDNADG